MCYLGRFVVCTNGVYLRRVDGDVFFSNKKNIPPGMIIPRSQLLVVVVVVVVVVVIL